MSAQFHTLSPGPNARSFAPRSARAGAPVPAAAPPAAGLVVAVVVTHNRPALLLEVLEALARQTRAADAIVVVDNASGPATAEVLRDRELTVVRSETNLGGAGGYALGVQHAAALGGDWMWLMDDDAVPEPTALAALEQHLQDVPGGTAVVCSQVREFGAVATLHRRHFGPYLGAERPFGPRAYDQPVVPVDTASFVGFMVSAAAVRAAGLPRGEFFLSYDDTEYSLRLRRLGYSLWLVPDSVILHKRKPAGRMRHNPFGPTHYFNVRNRIVVRRAYCDAGLLAAVGAALLGVAIWLRTPQRFATRSLRVLAAAIADGFSGRLGPFPERLRQEARP